MDRRGVDLLVLVSAVLALSLASAPRDTYSRALADLASDRAHYATELTTARSKPARTGVLARARERLFTALRDELLPAWVGTRWSFHGTSAVPGEGEIACGMFVGTIFEHAGFDVDRIALGRLASERIALELTHERNLKRFRNTSVAEVERVLADWGEGLYMVGLDYHAGLILVDRTGIATFVHSSYYAQQSVVFEPLDGPNPFQTSKYRVIAKLLDDAMIERWLKSKPAAD